MTGGMIKDSQTHKSTVSAVSWLLSGFGTLDQGRANNPPEKRGNRLAQFWAKRFPSDQNHIILN